MEFGKKGVDLPLTLYWPKVADINDYVYLLDTERTKKLLVLDLARKMWNALASLPLDGSCARASMAALNGKLGVVGGPDKICAWYNPPTGSWSIDQTVNKVHRNGSLLVHGNTLLILGGSSGGGTVDMCPC